jgi:hypothetical protein
MVRHSRPERTLVLLRCFTARDGRHFLDRSDQYRRFAQECLEMARTSESGQNRVALIQMAQLWLRLAEARAADDPGHRRDGDPSTQIE